jgi:cyclase
MYRSLIVARIRPGCEPAVARIFADSDTTDLPHTVGVLGRELYSLGDCYVHLLDTERPAAAALGAARSDAEFARVSDELRSYISPYLPTWRGPQDAVASCFYRWRPGSGQPPGTGTPA